MSLQGSDETSGSGIPDLDRVVVRRRHQLAARGQLGVRHELRVTLQSKPGKNVQVIVLKTEKNPFKKLSFN